MRLQEAQLTHLVLQGIGGQGAASGEVVRAFLRLAVAEMGMTPVGQPVVHTFATRDGHTDSGVTGFQIIVESHLAVHTWPEWGNLVAIDLFSCKPFDVPRLREVCRSFWRFSYMGTRTIERNDALEMVKGEALHAP